MHTEYTYYPLLLRNTCSFYTIGHNLADKEYRWNHPLTWHIRIIQTTGVLQSPEYFLVNVIKWLTTENKHGSISNGKTRLALSHYAALTRRISLHKIGKYRRNWIISMNFTQDNGTIHYSTTQLSVFHGNCIKMTILATRCLFGSSLRLISSVHLLGSSLIECWAKRTIEQDGSPTSQ